MNLNAARDGSDRKQTTDWLASALAASGCRAMERYLLDIERKLDG